MSLDENIKRLEKSLKDILNGPDFEQPMPIRIELEEVDKIGALKIIINPNEHAPPHFHVKYQNFEACFKIEDCEKLNRNIENSDLRKIKKWFKQNKELLIETWNRTRPTNCPVGEINQ